ncbi:MAG: Crp/Fnr family transcriptional regulator [Burkholderiaceae bacterium]
MSNDVFPATDGPVHVASIRCVDCPLRRCEVFQPIGGTELAVIDQLKRADLGLPAGSQLIREHGDDHPLYTLLAGWAIRYKTLQGGRRQILNVLLPGDFIGLQQKMDDAAHHGVEAITDVHVCRFARDAVWTLHRELPSLGYDVTWLAAHENALVDDNLLSVGRRTALERAAAMLLTLQARAQAHGAAGEDGAGTFFPLTQHHLADVLGLSLVHTNRTLRELQRRGLYEVRAGARLVLPDPAALARLGHLRWPLVMPRRPLI